MLFIHLVQYGQCHMEFEYTEQGEVYMVVIPSMSPLSVHTAIPTVAFLPLSRLSIRFQVQILLRPDDGSYTSE